MCNCLDAENITLTCFGCKLGVATRPDLTDPRPVLMVEPLNPAEKPVMVIAEYCPFCGEKYQDKPK